MVGRLCHPGKEPGKSHGLVTTRPGNNCEQAMGGFPATKKSLEQAEVRSLSNKGRNLNSPWAGHTAMEGAWNEKGQASMLSSNGPGKSHGQVTNQPVNNFEQAMGGYPATKGGLERAVVGSRSNQGKDHGLATGGY